MTHSEVIQAVSNWFKLKPEVEIVTRFSYSFPIPDIQVQFVDGTLIQIECKPSNANRREYLTGLGQAVAFCKHSDKSYLALPTNEYNLMKEWLWPDFIGVIRVEPNNVVVEREPKSPQNVSISKEPIKRGYAYYRDLKSFEIHSILRSIHNALSKTKEKKRIDEEIWKSVTKLRNWRSSKQSHLLNIKLLFRDLKLFDFHSLEILALGSELLSIDGNNEHKIKESLRRLFLIEGNYIDIVGLIQEVNDAYESFKDREDFREKLKESILSDKLASKDTNIERDLNDILRILKELEVIGDWKKVGAQGGKYPILWKNIINFVKFR